MSQTWKCQNGRELLITEMTHQHILNCLDMMRRKGYKGVQESLWYFTASSRGDMAQMGMEQELDDLKIHPKIDQLEAELKRRHTK